MITCRCHSLQDLAVIDMGHHDDVFRTLEELRVRGEPWWWLYVSRCTVCAQTWLIAQEERQNDVFILRRLDPTASEHLLVDNIWPDDFDRFERLLEIGRSAGKTVCFVDPADSSLLYTIEDLATERPGISVSALASLLNLDLATAAQLARIVAARSAVNIEFDAQ